ncbi:MAG: hypothetical protein PHQ65_15735 [Bacteroidales bacterium]|nr:hypothetical protein [Bacteroidales bacterium]MDD3666716.1 hypothetical protein [Bacteroidales bacterium]
MKQFITFFLFWFTGINHSTGYGWVCPLWPLLNPMARRNVAGKVLPQNQPLFGQFDRLHPGIEPWNANLAF